MNRSTWSAEVPGLTAVFRSALPTCSSAAAGPRCPWASRISPFWRWRKGSSGESLTAASVWNRAMFSRPRSR